MLGRDFAEMEEEKNEEEMSKDEEGKEGEHSGSDTPKVKYNQKCPKHNFILHSYLKSTKELLCN